MTQVLKNTLDCIFEDEQEFKKYEQKDDLEDNCAASKNNSNKTNIGLQLSGFQQTMPEKVNDSLKKEKLQNNTQSKSKPKQSQMSNTLKILLTIGSVIFVIILSIAIYYLYRKRKSCTKIQKLKDKLFNRNKQNKSTTDTSKQVTTTQDIQSNNYQQTPKIVQNQQIKSQQYSDIQKQLLDLDTQITQERNPIQSVNPQLVNFANKQQPIANKQQPIANKSNIIKQKKVNTNNGKLDIIAEQVSEQVSEQVFEQVSEQVFEQVSEYPIQNTQTKDENDDQSEYESSFETETDQDQTDEQDNELSIAEEE